MVNVPPKMYKVKATKVIGKIESQQSIIRKVVKSIKRYARGLVKLQMD